MQYIDKKDLVEGCPSLDATAWRQAGILRPEALCGGYWAWSAFTLGYILDTRDLLEATLWLLEPTSQADASLVAHIPLDTTHTPNGGVRLWWRCPECSRRSGKLFRPHSGSYFACRWCHNLAYVSNQRQGCDDRLHEALAAHAPGTTPADWHTQRMLVFDEMRQEAAGWPVE